MVTWFDERIFVHQTELIVSHDNTDAAQIPERRGVGKSWWKNESEDAGRQAKHLTVEVGCRGYISARLRI